MSTQQINPNLIQINRYRFVNAFLVREEDGFTLVDTTVRGSADELVAAGACPVGRPLSGCVAPASVAPSALKAEPAFAMVGGPPSGIIEID